VLGSDVVYSEGAVVDLLDTLVQLCGAQTTIFLAGELRNGECLSLPCPCMLAHPTHTHTHTHTRRHMQVLKILIAYSCGRCCPRVFPWCCDEGICCWACGADTVASRILQPQSSYVCSGEEVNWVVDVHSLRPPSASSFSWLGLFRVLLDLVYNLVKFN